jgi:maltose/maltodextrin transport system substrate-binding protein
VAIDSHLTRRSWLRLAAAGLLSSAASALATSLVGTVKPSASSEPLVVWFTVEGAKAMRIIAARFTADTGVEVVIETPDTEGPSKFQQAAAAGKGPDLFIYAHDRLGEWIAGGLLHAIAPSKRMLDDIDPLAWKGFTYRGRLWGYPYAIEAITLVYNRALVPQPPKTFEEVFDIDARLAKQGKKAILWDYSNTYFTWPLFAANGGYAFKQRPDGTYDGRDTGVNNAGALIGASLLERMMKEGLMPTGSGYAEMETAMAQGKVAMMINGPWSWLNLKRANIDFGVAKIPMVSGKAAVPFVGIKGIVINRSTKQREVAVEFIENYLLSPQGLREINAAEPIGAPASREFYNALKADPHIAMIMQSAQDGVPTPSNPEMGRFWAAMKSSLTTLSEGRLSAAKAMEAAARRILG